MPQLDINTFLIQYTSLMLLVVMLYVLISYVVFPITLRSILLRSKLLVTGMTSEDKDSYWGNKKVKYILSSVNNMKLLSLLVNAQSGKPTEGVNFTSTNLLASYPFYLLLLVTIETKTENLTNND